LSNTQGLLKSADGLETAAYLVRCALSVNQVLAVKDWAGTLRYFRGDIGMAPEWQYGSCSKDCEEKVSACMLALTNGDGLQVEIALASPAPNIGPEVSNEAPHETLPYRGEAAWFGNIFAPEAEAYFCIHDNSPRLRMCTNYSNTEARDCPYDSADQFFCKPWGAARRGAPKPLTGACDSVAAPYATNAYGETWGGAVTNCKGGGKVWSHVITTYRLDPWNVDRAIAEYRNNQRILQRLGYSSRSEGVPDYYWWEDADYASP
jgi:hypothetical protein